jgi:ABC-type lipoprotein release transport system permease subunit
MNAVPLVTVPVLTIVLIGVSTVVLANVVAVYPGFRASRTPPALALRAE